MKLHLTVEFATDMQNETDAGATWDEAFAHAQDQLILSLYTEAAHIRYPKSKLVHRALGGWPLRAACGWVPKWHKGAKEVDEPVTCQRCLHGPSRTAWR